MELYQLAYVMYHEAVSRDSGTSANYQQMQDQLGLDITSLSLVHGEIVAKRSQKKAVGLVSITQRGCRCTGPYKRMMRCG